jgi:hypothetical protein
MARPDDVVLAAGAADVATNSGPMIIGGWSVTTGEDIVPLEYSIVSLTCTVAS